MPNITAPALTFPTRSFPVNQQGAPAGVVGELSISQVLPKYSNLVKSQRVFYTSAIITSSVIFTTAAQLGPMLWNRPGSGVDAHILALSIGSPTTAWTNTIAGAIGIATVTQPTAPASIGTAITAVNAYAGGGPSQMGYVGGGGTVIILPVPQMMPLIGVSAGAITTQVISAPSYVDVGGAIVINPGNVGYVAPTATLTSGVLTIGILWAELPS